MGVGGQRHAPAALPPGMTRYPLYRRLDKAPEPVWTGAKNLAHTGIRSPDRPARSESLYRLRYPCPRYIRKLLLKRGQHEVNNSPNYTLLSSVLRDSHFCYRARHLLHWQPFFTYQSQSLHVMPWSFLFTYDAVIFIISFLLLNPKRTLRYLLIVWTFQHFKHLNRHGLQQQEDYPWLRGWGERVHLVININIIQLFHFLKRIKTIFLKYTKPLLRACCIHTKNEKTYVKMGLLGRFVFKLCPILFWPEKNKELNINRSTRKYLFTDCGFRRRNLLLCCDKNNNLNKCTNFCPCASMCSKIPDALWSKYYASYTLCCSSTASLTAATHTIF
jgi:hypothetical protein